MDEEPEGALDEAGVVMTAAQRRQRAHDRRLDLGSPCTRQIVFGADISVAECQLIIFRSFFLTD